jgi:hypothetical protein
MHPVEKPEPIDMGTTSIFERKQLLSMNRLPFIKKNQ